MKLVSKESNHGVSLQDLRCRRRFRHGRRSHFLHRNDWCFCDTERISSSNSDDEQALTKGKPAAASRVVAQEGTRRVPVRSTATVQSQAAIEQLREIRGIGRWTAEYVLLRALGRYDLFPGDDVGARTKLAQWLGLKGPVDYLGVQRALADLGPYRGLLYFHLQLDGLQKTGQLSQSPEFSTMYTKGM